MVALAGVRVTGAVKGKTWSFRMIPLHDDIRGNRQRDADYSYRCAELEHILSGITYR